MQNENFSQIDDALNKAASRVLATNLSSLMQMPNRDRFIYQFEDLTVDCTRQLLDDEGMMALLHFAEKCQLQTRINEMFSGAPVNITEHKPVQHMAARTPDHLASIDYQKL